MAARLLLVCWWLFVLLLAVGTRQTESLLVYDHQTLLDIQFKVGDVCIWNGDGRKTAPPVLSGIPAHLFRI